jgi:hypothetical protein
MLKIVFRESRDLGCPMSEFVQKSAREPSRAIFGQLDNSARLGPRSDTPKILDLGSAVGRTERENLSECRPLLDNLSTKTGSWSISLSEIRP